MLLPSMSAATTLLPILSRLNSDYSIVLASGSPRRRELMQLMGFTDVKVRVSTFSENLDKKSFPSAADYCLATAVEKGREVSGRMRSEGEWRDKTLLFSADTVVEIDGQVLEKPADKEEALAMLTRLSGAQHTVHTGVAVFTGRTAADGTCSPRTLVESTRVKFGDLSAADIEAYVSTGEPFDKAGGYGIQGLGGQLVEGVFGCYFNVMGLPIRALAQQIAQMLSNGEL